MNLLGWVRGINRCGAQGGQLDGRRDRAEVSTCDGRRDTGGIQGWIKDWSWPPVGMRPRTTFTVFSPWASVVDKQVSFWRPLKGRKWDRKVGRTLSLLFHLAGQGQVLYSFSSRGKEWTLGTLWQEGRRWWDPAGNQPPGVRSEPALASHCLGSTPCPHSDTVWHWATQLIALCLSSLICEMGFTTKPLSQGCSKD